MRSDSCRALTKAEDGTVWVGTDDGLFRIADTPEDVPIYPLPTGSENGETVTLPTRVNHLCIDSQGELWLTVNGSGYRGFPGRFRRLSVVRRLPDNPNEPRLGGLGAIVISRADEAWGVTAWGIGPLRDDGLTLEAPWIASLNPVGPSGHGLVTDPSGHH